MAGAMLISLAFFALLVQCCQSRAQFAEPTNSVLSKDIPHAGQRDIDMTENVRQTPPGGSNADLLFVTCRRCELGFLNTLQDDQRELCTIFCAGYYQGTPGTNNNVSRGRLVCRTRCRFSDSDSYIRSYDWESEEINCVTYCDTTGAIMFPDLNARPGRD